MVSVVIDVGEEAGYARTIEGVSVGVSKGLHCSGCDDDGSSCCA
jgi:hypothetical protein